jgi:hypothetical protein
MARSTAAHMRTLSTSCLEFAIRVFKLNSLALDGPCCNKFSTADQPLMGKRMSFESGKKFLIYKVVVIRVLTPCPNCFFRSDYTKRLLSQSFLWDFFWQGGLEQKWRIKNLCVLRAFCTLYWHCSSFIVNTNQLHTDSNISSATVESESN